MSIPSVEKWYEQEASLLPDTALRVNKAVRLALVEPAQIKTQVSFDYLEVKRRQVL